MTEMLREISSRHLSHKCKLSPSLGLRLHGQSASRERGEGAAASALHVWGRTKPASNLGLCSALAGSEEGPPLAQIAWISSLMEKIWTVIAHPWVPSGCS